MGTALITGASAGIGRELAKIFASDGWNVVLVSRREERLQALAADLEAEFEGMIAHVVPADLARDSAPQAIFDGLTTDGIEVDALVNNAGIGSNGKFWELDPERELDQIHVNIAALVHLSRLFVPGMVERGSGRVLNIASTAGFQPGPYMATYYATKAFVLSFTQAIAYELDGTGVTATAHCPGATDTEFAERAGNESSNLFQKQSPATPDEVARDAYRAMKSGKWVKVHGFTNQVGAFMTRFSPPRVVASIAAKLNEEA